MSADGVDLREAEQMVAAVNRGPSRLDLSGVSLRRCRSCGRGEQHARSIVGPVSPGCVSPGRPASPFPGVGYGAAAGAGMP
jgi:hypothetical protein